MAIMMNNLNSFGRDVLNALGIDPHGVTRTTIDISDNSIITVAVMRNLTTDGRAAVLELLDTYRIDASEEL